MTFEEKLVGLLGPLVSFRVYPDVTPDKPEFPLIVYQGVGGQAQWYVEGKRREKRHVRVQVCVWAKTRMEANAVADRVANAICESDFSAKEPYGESVALYEEAIKKYGARQDFGIWHQS